MLARIECLHSIGYLHRDVKPENFLLGLGRRSHVLYVVDFGLGKRFCDDKTGEHIPYKENRSLSGTIRYSSINNHLGIETSRRDDMEAIGYVAIYFMNGFLPW